MDQACALCQKKTCPILEDGYFFCCRGCSFVYRVLKGRGIEPSSDDPLYQKAEKLGLFEEGGTKRREGQKREGDEQRFAFWIEGLFCPSCQHLLEHVIRKQDGVLSITVDYTTDLCLVWYQPRFISPDELFNVIRSLGYSPHSLESLDQKGWTKKLRWQLGIAAFSTLNVMMASYPLLGEGISEDSKWGLFFTLYAFLFALPVPFYAAWPLLKQGINALFRGSFGIEAFISVAMVSGFLLSLWNLSNNHFELYLDVATLLPTLFLFGKLLESRVKGEARERLIEVAKTLPLRGRKVSGDKNVFVLLKEVKKGDELLILRGEKVVLDGEVVEGEGTIDEGVVTGESIPLQRQLGDRLMAGSRLVEGWVKIRVLTPQEGSTLQTMVSLIEEGLTKRTLPKNLLEQFIPYFLPLILGMALFLFFWRGPLEGLSLLLLACPCTIGIALPLARSRLAAELGAKGIIVRRMESLDYLGGETHLVLDKTGTLTEGEPECISGLEAFSDVEKGKLKTLVSFSNHPLCRSLQASLGSIVALPLEEVKEFVGKGMEGGGARLGSRAWFEEMSLTLPTARDELELFYQTNENIFPLLFQEKLREGMEPWIKSLKGVSVEILSGDRQERVEKIARRLSISTFRGGVTPKGKLERILEIQKGGGSPLFVGDGVNDGPALSMAHLSASPEGGQDLTLFVSDLIVRGRFDKMIEARNLGAKTKRIVLQNFILTFSYNTLAILWVFFGFGLTPLLSIFVMTISSVTVICNAYRIKY